MKKFGFHELMQMAVSRVARETHFLTKLSFGHRDKAIKVIDVTR